MLIPRIHTFWSLSKSLVLYGIIGSCTAMLDFLLFSGLTLWTPLHYLLANALSCSTGILCSFLLNRKYNFKVTDHPVRRMILFFSVGIFGLFLSSTILRFCIESLNIERTVSKLITILIVGIVQFLLNKFISFRKVGQGNHTAMLQPQKEDHE